jgi:toxin ParE1/3/4
MTRIARQPLARRDLIEIWNYIADGSVRSADALIDQVDAKLTLLATNPKLGRTRDELSVGLRSVSVGRYILFYQILPDGILLVRVLHSARDLAPLLEGYV